MSSMTMVLRIAALCAAVFFLGCQLVSPRDTEAYQLLGRYHEVEPGRYIMNWPGSGFKIRFNGTVLNATIEDDGNGIMDVIVNGTESAPIGLKSGAHSYEILRVTDAQDLTVTLTRRTEVFDTGSFILSNISHDGRGIKTPPSNRRVIFVGDSITAGFGVRGETKSCDYLPATNAPLMGYAALSADILGADYHLIAISGRGVVYNWDNNPNPVMPVQIDLTLADDPNGEKWDHSRFQADIIVIALGTNDWSVINPGKEKFRAGYLSLLRDLRARYKDAHIIAVNGPLLDGDKKASVRDGIDYAIDTFEDENVSTLDVALASDGLVWSCNSHPGQDSMKEMAKLLAKHISLRTDWRLKR